MEAQADPVSQTGPRASVSSGTWACTTQVEPPPRGSGDTAPAEGRQTAPRPDGRRIAGLSEWGVPTSTGCPAAKPGCAAGSSGSGTGDTRQPPPRRGVPRSARP